MGDNDFDDFFEVDSEKAPEAASPATSKKVEQTSPEAVAPPVIPAPKAPPANPPEGKTDNQLLSDFGDFDALFDKAGSEPLAPAAPTSPADDAAVEDLLSDFGQEKSEPAPGGSKPSVRAEDLFDDLLTDEPAAQSRPAQKAAVPPPPPSRSAPPPPSPPRPSPSPMGEESKPEEALEELFSDVAEGSIPEIEPSGEVLSAGLGLEYKQRKKKFLKPLLIAVPSLIVAVGIAAVLMARFTSSGFFGWRLGQGAKDGYVAPSSSVLKKLDAQYLEASQFFSSDRVEDYRKAESMLEAILKVDTRHSPTDARLAEALLLISSNSISANTRKRVQSLIEQSEKYHPGLIESLRSKARSQLADGQFGQADSLSQRALSIDAKDLETLTLKGEVAYGKTDFEAAVTSLNQALAVDPKYPRARYFLALSHLALNRVDEAERILRQLTEMSPPHPSSELELLRLKYLQRKEVAPAKEGLKRLVETRAKSLNAWDLGRAWRSLAEIAEAEGDIGAALGAMEKSVEADRGSDSNGFYLGRLYLGRKEYEKAAGEFSRASSLAPNSAEYLIYQGHALREMGKLNESLAELQKALEKEPLNVEGLFQLGLTQRSLTRIEESITSFENVLKSDSRHIDALINLGELYMSRDNFSMAKNHLNTAITLAPQSARAHNAMGEVLLTTRKPEEAMAEFKAAEALEEKNVSVLSNLGRTYLTLGKMEKAAEYFEKALTLDPTRLDTQVALGELQHQKKEYIKAMDTYREVLKSRPKDFDTRVKLARVLIDQNSFQDAVTELQEAAKYNSNYYPTRLHLGIAWRGLGNLDASLEQLSYALRIRPEAADAHYQTELTYIFRNDAINADKAMEKAVGFDNKFADPLIALGDYYSSKHLYLKSVEYYKRAETINPRDTSVLIKIADGYRSDEKFKDAAVYYRKALAIDKSLSEGYLGLGLIEEEAENRTKAIALMRKAQATDPNDPRPYYYLGFLYKDTNQAKNAVLAFRKYLKLDPASKEKKDIEDTIYHLTHQP